MEFEAAVTGPAREALKHSLLERPEKVHTNFFPFTLL